MTSVPNTVFSQYESILKKRNIPPSCYPDYKKWLRYYLDYCAKYPLPESKSERVQLFSKKLQMKKQSEQQRQQAIHAVFLYYEMLSEGGARDCESIAESIDQDGLSTPPASTPEEPMNMQRKSQYCDAGYQVKSSSPEWDAVLEVMAGEIKVRHYSRRTLKTYANWSRQFQRFLKNKPPQELSSEDVKAYLTFLAVKCKVAASTQNQAFCIGV